MKKESELNSKVVNENPLVLVTGGTGFIASHCILQLLEAGYRVRTTIRSANKERDIRNTLLKTGAENVKLIQFFVADLMSDEGWDDAVKDCDYVLHVASPFPQKIPKDENELIVPAREGALRVLRASRDAGVKRVVLTSSFAAIGYSPKESKHPYTEKDWTNPDEKNITAYVKSKTLAEKAAWDFMEREGGRMELSVVNPVGVFGPVFSSDYSTSVQIVKRLLDRSMPGCPRLTFGVVDVRDVADLHLRAMIHPDASGERFLAVSGMSMSMLDMAVILAAHLDGFKNRIPLREIPDWLLKIMSVFDSSIRQIIPELGTVKHASNSKAKKILGWSPRPNKDTILATAESLVNLKLV